MSHLVVVAKYLLAYDQLATFLTAAEVDNERPMAQTRSYLSRISSTVAEHNQVT